MTEINDDAALESAGASAASIEQSINVLIDQIVTAMYSDPNAVVTQTQMAVVTRLFVTSVFASFGATREMIVNREEVSDGPEGMPV